jgi:hypothetical protein
VDVHVDQLDAAHHDPAQGDTAETGIGQVDGAELRAAEVNAFEPRATEIGANEVSHGDDAIARCRQSPPAISSAVGQLTANWKTVVVW